MDDATKDKLTKLGMVAGGIALVIVLIVILYKLKFFGYFNYSEATILSAVVLIGLALVVLLAAVLAMIYSGIGITNKDQPLGLPEGSVRSLIAFSLVLIFVLLAVFLYSNVSRLQTQPWALTNVTKAQLDALGKDYVVVSSEAMKDAKGDPTLNENKEPLYSVTYYGRHSKDGDDFAKQIFTTLATIFTSVISFYFGSGVATSGAGAVAKAIAAASPEKPSITKLDPPNVTADSKNQLLKIIGSRLGKVTKIKIGSAEITPDPKNVSENLITVTIPDAQLSSKGSLKVVVVSESGEASMDLPVQ